MKMQALDSKKNTPIANATFQLQAEGSQRPESCNTDKSGYFTLPANIKEGQKIAISTGSSSSAQWAQARDEATLKVDASLLQQASQASRAMGANASRGQAPSAGAGRGAAPAARQDSTRGSNETRRK